MAEPRGDASDAEIKQIIALWQESCRQDQLVMRGNLPDQRSDLPGALIEMARDVTVRDLRVRRGAQSLALDNPVESALRQLFLLGRILTRQAHGLDFEHLVAALGSAAETISQLHVETAQQQAMTDEMTGIGNLRGFKRDLTGALGRVRTGNGSFSLAMVDLDGLKVVNDEFGGHLAGDEYIKGFSRHLQDFVRPHRGRVFRYGGDEFTVIFRDMDRETAEELLTSVADDPAVPPFCFGVASCPAEGQEADQLLGIADDERLYEMKDALGKETRSARARDWLGSAHWSYRPPGTA